jgi:hypothetical protein
MNNTTKINLRIFLKGYNICPKFQAKKLPGIGVSAKGEYRYIVQRAEYPVPGVWGVCG